MAGEKGKAGEFLYWVRNADCSRSMGAGKPYIPKQAEGPDTSRAGQMTS